MNNTLLSSVTALLVTLATASPSWAAGTFLKAKVSGTVQTQTPVPPSDGRIHSAKLDSKRIFDEFGVSSDQYELVVSLGVTLTLELLPKLSAAKLPTILVVELGSDSQEIFDTKARTIALGGSIAPGTATNLFENIAGEIAGTARYQGTPISGVITKLVLGVTGRGTDTSGVGPALLKFKIAAAGSFVQQ
jgi:hypothetical protein